MNGIRIFTIAFICLFASLAQAFPELARHGYFNCVACHVSPSGGGVLTEYGRSLSKELLSTWGSEGEEKFLYVGGESENFRLGGDIRSIQTYLDDPAVRTGDFFVMQSDLEAAVSFKNWFFDLVLGTQGGPKTLPKKDTFLTRRHYVGYKFSDEWNIRYGKFLVNFGWNQANHVMVTERDLQFDQGRETYNLEASYLGEKYNFFVTQMSGRPDDADIDGMRGAAASAAISLAEKNTIGVSVLSGKTNAGGTRQLAGVYGLWAFHEKFFWLFEYDHQWRQPNLSPGMTTEEKGAVTYNRINYEAYRGVNVYGLHQVRYLNYHAPRTRFDSYGVGLQFFPRPHIEFQAEFQKQRDISRYDNYYDSAFVLFHYYL